MSRMIFKVLDKEWQRRRISLPSPSSLEVSEAIVGMLVDLEALTHSIRGETKHPEHYWKVWGGMTLLVRMIKQELHRCQIRSFSLYFEELHSLVGVCWALHHRLTEEQVDRLEICIISVDHHLAEFLRGSELTNLKLLSESIEESTDLIVSLYSDVTR